MDLFTTKVYGQKNKKIIFVFGGLGSFQLLFWFTGQALSSHGYKTIIYTNTLSILSPDPHETRLNFLKIKNDALKRIKKLPKKQQNDIAVFGTSIGNIPAFMIANEVPGVKKVIANIPPADLSETVWNWRNKKFNFRGLLKDKKITKKKLRQEWFELNPINNLDNFTNKKLLLFATKNDEVFPYTQAKQIIEKCEEDHLEFEAIINSRHKHLVSSILNILRFPTYIDFLTRK